MTQKPRNEPKEEVASISPESWLEDHREALAAHNERMASTGTFLMPGWSNEKSLLRLP